MRKDEAEIKKIIKDLEPMILEAERKELMIQCRGMHREVRFTPAEFRQSLSDGKFVWGSVNWMLEEPTLVEQGIPAECPFCGDIPVAKSSPFGYFWTVTCNCGVAVGGTSMSEVIEKWNRRIK